MHRSSRPLPLHLIGIAALLCGATVCAETGYKCTDAAGRISFQDSPCPRGATTDEFRYRPDRSPAPAPATPAQDEHTPPTAAAPPPAAPVAPPPTLYACTKPDGERYYSDTGRTTPYQMPIGMLGYPPSGVGDAFRNGRSQLSAPPSSRPPVAAPGGNNQIAAGYTWVEDRCDLLSPMDACNELRRELDKTATKRRRAFKDERSTLEAREHDLTERLAGC
jgi:hypothetical protein